jgi:hypothetical protein
VSLYNGTYNHTYDTDTTYNCIQNASVATMTVCALDLEIVSSSIIYYTVWLVANGNTIDSLIGTPITVTTGTAI